MAKSHSEAGSAKHRKPNSCHATSEAERRIADAGVSDRRRGRGPDRGGQGQSVRSPRRHHDPHGLSVTASVRASWWTFAGIRSTSTGRPWLSVGSSRAARARIPSRAMNYGRCAGFSGSRKPSHPSCSRLSAARPSPRQALLAWWSVLASRLSWAFKAHPHMLRHACGFALANKGHDTRALQAYLGHRNIQHTVRYTELSPDRFKDFWR